MRTTAFISLCFALTILCTLPSVSGTKPTNDSDEKMILALESAWNQAELHHDAKAAGALMSDNFVSVDHTGAVSNRAQYLSGIKDKSFNPEQISNYDTRVFVYGSTAIVTSGYKTRGKDGGKAFIHNGRFTDTWVNLGDRWVCVASHETWISK